MAVGLLAGHAVADTRVNELAKTLTTSSSDKARLSAVAALARLNDRNAMKPLVGALTDPNPQVRALAAAALGRLGHKSALPALKAAADDADPTVSARAKEAAIAVAKANRLPDPWPVAVAAAPTPQARKYGGRAGFGRQAHAVENHADLYVTINTSADDSPGKADKATRKMHSEILKQSLSASFKASPMVTTIQADAQRWGLDPRHLDLSVIKLDVAQSGQYIEIEAQLRLAISDHKGKMLSFVSGGAKVQVPKRTFNAKYLPNLRKEAIENAMRGMFDKLLVQLRDKSQS
ncbi:MAG: HEAT repeat domain-containing protein [Deltaproteobacteria bacterium]|nr:HEAT repeat domain-containing protein [Deltaproteobacteria bacterium]